MRPGPIPTIVTARSDYPALFRAHVGEDLANEVRAMTDRGLALGDSRFVEEMERLTGRRLRPGRMGRPPKDEQASKPSESRT